MICQIISAYLNFPVWSLNRQLPVIWVIYRVGSLESIHSLRTTTKITVFHLEKQYAGFM